MLRSVKCRFLQKLDFYCWNCILIVFVNKQGVSDGIYTFDNAAALSFMVVVVLWKQMGENQ